MSLPMMASSMASHRTMRGTNGYSSLQSSAKCLPVTTPNLAANNYSDECVGREGRDIECDVGR